MQHIPEPTLGSLIGPAIREMANRVGVTLGNKVSITDLQNIETQIKARSNPYFTAVSGNTGDIISVNNTLSLLNLSKKVIGINQRLFDFKAYFWCNLIFSGSQFDHASTTFNDEHYYAKLYMDDNTLSVYLYKLVVLQNGSIGISLIAERSTSNPYTPISSSYTGNQPSYDSYSTSNVFKIDSNTFRIIFSVYDNQHSQGKIFFATISLTDNSLTLVNILNDYHDNLELISSSNIIFYYPSLIRVYNTNTVLYEIDISQYNADSIDCFFKYNNFRYVLLRRGINPSYYTLLRIKSDYSGTEEIFVDRLFYNQNYVELLKFFTVEGIYLVPYLNTSGTTPLTIFKINFPNFTISSFNVSNTRKAFSSALVLNDSYILYLADNDNYYIENFLTNDFYQWIPSSEFDYFKTNLSNLSNVFNGVIRNSQLIVTDNYPTVHYYSSTPPSDYIINHHHNLNINLLNS